MDTNLLSPETIELDFDIDKAKELTRILLKSDIDYYKNLLTEIEQLSPKEFQKLFEGDSRYNYSSKKLDNIKRLSIKFYEFQTILKPWYKDKEKYEYLKELWIYYPCLDELRRKGHKFIFQFLNENLENYSKWPEAIKENLIKNIQGSFYEDKIKEIIRKEYKQIHHVIDQLEKIEELFQIENNKDQSKSDKIKNFFMDNFSECSKFLKNINWSELLLFIFKNLKSAIFTKNISFVVSKIYESFWNLWNKKGNNNSNTKIQNKSDDNDKKLVNKENYGKDNDGSNSFFNFYDILETGVNICELFRVFFKIFNTKKELDHFDLENNEKNELDNIINDIRQKYLILDNINLYNDNNQKTDLDIIKDILNELEDKQKKLKNLMEKIKRKIDEKQREKNKGIGNLIIQGFNCLFYALNFKKGAFYVINTFTNGATMAINAYDLKYQTEIISKLIDIYNKAENESKKLEQKKDKLKEEFNKIKERCPKIIEENYIIQNR